MMNKFATNSDLLLIPSATIVPDELRLDVGSIPTGMIPLRGNPILDHIAEKYNQIDVNRVVAVHEEADMIEQYVAHSEFEWHTVDVGETTSLGDTVATALESLKSPVVMGQHLYLNFGDTLVPSVCRINGVDYISCKETDRAYRWTTFQSEDGKISQICPKHEMKKNRSQMAFIGQFGLTDAEEFLSYLSDSEVWRDSSLPRFYAALSAYLDSRTHELYVPESWYDVGHLDTYHRTSKEFLNAREFNEFQVDAKNVITKRSEDAEILKNEIEWYHQIPSDLQPYLPRLYDWSTDPSEVYVSMEYIGYPSLADIQLYGSHGRHIWGDIFRRIFDLISDFEKHSPDTSTGSAVITKALEDMYVTKTRRRINQLRDDPMFAEIFESDYIIINGTAVQSLDNILTQLKAVARRESLLMQKSMCIIHGDLCLPNILYDPRNEILKVIDPRGEFGKFTIYGDQRYDLAKLRHSFAGHYEHLVNGHYSVSWSASDSEISYDIDVSDAQHQRAARFDSFLEERTNTPIREVKIIEALLFLSMASLHSDSPERQLCMLAQGLEKIAPYLNEGDF